MKKIDLYLNKITMYRLVLYELIVLIVAAAILGFFGLLPYSPLLIGFSLLTIGLVSWITNSFFAYFFDAPSNPESTYITALILVLIITPALSFTDATFYQIAFWAAAWAMVSKYIFAIREKHIFNPAALGVAVTGIFLNQGASWWVGTPIMIPFVLVGGFLIVRKIRRFDMVAAFYIMLAVTILVQGFGQGLGVFHTLWQAFLYAPAIFFGTVMLTEPLTAPADKYWRILYGALIGFLFAPQTHFGSFYLTPEYALLMGNIFAYIVSPKQKLLLVLKEKIQVATDTFELVFAKNRPLQFVDKDIRLGVKFYQPMSSFKKALQSLEVGDTIVAGQLAGDFVLPKDPKKKLVFMAGGIGITPFKSMIQYLIDIKQRRDIVLVYANRTIEDTSYVQLLDTAEREIGLETLPVFATPPTGAQSGEFPEKIDSALIAREIPDYLEREYYISGPHSMVTAYKEILTEMGIPGKHIQEDFFPGFA
jgi:Na+-transporting NADH:ubiquinone oxidoreductase subunit NqrB